MERDFVFPQYRDLPGMVCLWGGVCSGSPHGGTPPHDVGFWAICLEKDEL